VLLDLLFELRAHRVPVGLQEWMALMEGLAKGLHESSLTGFYHLARSLLVHSEAHFDAFDQVFAHCFQGVELDALKLGEELEAWLRDPARLAYLSPEERALLQALDLAELRRQLEERLREQRGRHQGGNRWIGTGGTSPFGQGGYHPTGVRIGGSGGGRSAAQVAAERRYRAYRSDVLLDVRQIKVALRRLRELRREGSRKELDLEQTVEKTSRNAGELELVFRPPRRNNVKLLLLMDVGGSMDPHARLVSQLFSAAAQSKHFRAFHAFYFHNCIYREVYKESSFREAVPVSELVTSYGSTHKLVIAGDALMHPMELLDPGGALDYGFHNPTPGISWLRKLADGFERRAWLNPEPVRFWDHLTVRSIRELFPMFPLTLDGLEAAVAALVRARRSSALARVELDEEP
jgi:uncharacterized protein with von Willebrand factor type A (vWA) domain